MSNIFLKNNDISFLDSVTESQINLPSHINIIDKNNKVMSGGFNNMFSETSNYSKLNFNNINDTETSMFNTNNKVMSGGSKNIFSETSNYSKQNFNNINDSDTSLFLNNKISGGNNLNNISDSDTSDNKNINNIINSSTSDIKSSSLIKNLTGGNLNNINDSDNNIQKLLDMISSDSKSINQAGGNDNDINKLLDMLTTDSNDSFKKMTDTNTNTTELEKQLESIINKNQSGGFNNSRSLRNKLKNNLSNNNNNNIFVSNNSQCGGNNGLSVHQIKDFFNNLKLNGVDVNIKLDDHTMSEYFDLMQNSTTDLNQQGGRGANPAFQAIAKLRKEISKKYNIPNGIPVVKIASAIIKDIKSKNPSFDTVQAAEDAIKNFSKISDKYKSIIKK